MSEDMSVDFGCPQGSCLSPTLFLVLVADIDLWTEKSKNVAFADDTTSVSSGQDASEVIGDLERDAKNILDFMAANELVANPSKTGFMWMDTTGRLKTVEIMVGKEIISSVKSFGLLGVKIDHNLGWTTHVEDLCMSLRNRICIMKRLKSSLPPQMLQNFIEGLFTSKIRYGLALYCSVRTKDSDPTNGLMTRLQTLQNKMVRVVLGKRQADRINMAVARESLKIMSVNQLACYHTLIETWKIMNYDTLPELKQILTTTSNPNNMKTRSKKDGLVNIAPYTLERNRGFAQKCAKLWNSLPLQIRQNNKISSFKTEIKKYVRSLPQ